MRSLSLALKVPRRGRFDNSGDAEAGAATSIWPWSMGMSEMILPRLQV
jgi:hypothetical protein